MAFNTTTITKYGVFPAKGGYSCNETKTNGKVVKEFTFNYVVLGSEDTTSAYYYDDVTAKAAFLNRVYSDFGNTPVYIDGSETLPLYGITIQLSSEYDYRWDCSCTFKRPDSSENPSDSANSTPKTLPTVSGQDVKYVLGSGTAHWYRSGMTNENTQIAWYASGWTPMNFDGRVNVYDGETKGVDVVVPELSFQFTVNFRSMSAVALNTINNMVGTINNATWGPFPAGTVMFRGGDMHAEDWDKDKSYYGKYWKVTWNFQYNPSSVVTAPDGTLITKGGWQYIWGYRSKVEDINTGVIYDEVLQINKENIYPSTDFSLLGISWS